MDGWKFILNEWLQVLPRLISLHCGWAHDDFGLSLMLEAGQVFFEVKLLVLHIISFAMLFAIPYALA
jgi:hypothetical protein